MAYLDSSRSLSNLRVERRKFQAVGAAGTYSAQVDLPAGADLVDIIVNGVALWTAGTSALMEIGDAADPDGYFTAVNLKATDLLAGESISFALAGGKAGAYIANSQVSPRHAVAARSILIEVVTVGTASAVGTTVVDVVYAAPSDDNAKNASYVAT